MWDYLHHGNWGMIQINVLPTVESQLLESTTAQVLALHRDYCVGGDCSDSYLPHPPPPWRKTLEKTPFPGD